MTKQMEALIAQKDRAIKELEHVESEYNNIFNEKQVLNHELAESGKNLYEQKELLKMCLNKKQQLISDLNLIKATNESLVEKMRVINEENVRLTKEFNDVHHENARLQDVLDESDDYNNGSYWPLCDVGDDAFKYLSICLFLSVSVFCFTVYKIAQMIGF